jgi:RHS repeat-associated protein
VVSSNGNDVAQKFKYNGIELEESLGLDLYEMDVRMYNPAIARFNGIDPVTHHSQGTSVAFDNNPIFWADPSGADSVERVMGGMKYTGDAAIYVFNQLKDKYGGDDEEEENDSQNSNNDCPKGQECIGGPGGYNNELDEIVMSARTHNKSNYEYGDDDREMLAWLSTNFPSLYYSILERNKEGIYFPLSGGGRWGHFAAVWEAGSQSDLFPDSGLADFWSRFAFFTIGGTMAIGTVASTGMFGSFGMSSSQSTTSSFMIRNGELLHVYRNSLGQFQRGTGKKAFEFVRDRVFYRQYGLNGLGQSTGFTPVFGSNLPKYLKWSIGIGGAGAVIWWQVNNRGKKY